MDLCTNCKYDTGAGCSKGTKGWPKKLNEVCTTRKEKKQALTSSKPRIRYIRDNSIYLKVHI